MLLLKAITWSLPSYVPNISADILSIANWKGKLFLIASLSTFWKPWTILSPIGFSYISGDPSAFFFLYVFVTLPVKAVSLVSLPICFTSNISGLSFLNAWFCSDVSGILTNINWVSDKRFNLFK